MFSTLKKLAMVMLALMSTQAIAHEFCNGAPFVVFSNLVSHKNAYINMRIITRAILRTDLKEYTVIYDPDDKHASLLVASDEQSSRYIRNHHVKTISRSEILSDFALALRKVEGASYHPQRLKIFDYRQDRLLCGRLVRENFGFRFIIDDSVLKKSYFVDSKSGDKAR